MQIGQMAVLHKPANASLVNPKLLADLPLCPPQPVGTENIRKIGQMAVFTISPNGAFRNAKAMPDLFVCPPQPVGAEEFVEIGQMAVFHIFGDGASLDPQPLPNLLLRPSQPVQVPRQGLNQSGPRSLSESAIWPFPVNLLTVFHAPVIFACMPALDGTPPPTLESSRWQPATTNLYTSPSGAQRKGAIPSAAFSRTLLGCPAHRRLKIFSQRSGRCFFANTSHKRRALPLGAPVFRIVLRELINILLASAYPGVCRRNRGFALRRRVQNQSAFSQDFSQGGECNRNPAKTSVYQVLV